MSIISSAESVVKFALTAIAGGNAGGSIVSGSANSPASIPQLGAQEVTQPAKTISTVGSAINSVGDFLQLIAWIFYPLNWLRAVEFLTGLFLFYLGVRPYVDRSGRQLGGTGSHRIVRAIYDATPPGRATRVSQGRRMGAREGQRESARMEARREATRTEREASSLEREQRTIRTRRQARSGYLGN